MGFAALVCANAGTGSTSIRRSGSSADSGTNEILERSKFFLCMCANARRPIHALTRRDICSTTKTYTVMITLPCNASHRIERWRTPSVTCSTRREFSWDPPATSSAASRPLPKFQSAQASVRHLSTTLLVRGQFELRVGAAADGDRGEADPIWLGADPNAGHYLQRQQVEDGDVIAVYVGDVRVPTGWIDDDAVRSFARLDGTQHLEGLGLQNRDRRARLALSALVGHEDIPVVRTHICLDRSDADFDLADELSGGDVDFRDGVLAVHRCVHETFVWRKGDLCRRLPDLNFGDLLVGCGVDDAQGRPRDIRDVDPLPIWAGPQAVGARPDGDGGDRLARCSVDGRYSVVRVVGRVGGLTVRSNHDVGRHATGGSRAVQA